MRERRHGGGEYDENMLLGLFHSSVEIQQSGNPEGAHQTHLSKLLMVCKWITYFGYFEQSTIELSCASIDFTFFEGVLAMPQASQISHELTLTDYGTIRPY